jgi:hypothetical protein
MKIYEKEMYLPLKEKLYDAVNEMIKDDRDGKVVPRYKIRNTLRIFEEVDINNPELNKQGENIWWSGQTTNNYLNEWFNPKFIKMVIILILIIFINFIKYNF